MSEIQIKKLNYHEFAGRPRAWSIEGLELGRINLLVGKNATGKSRALNLIHNLAKLLLSDQLSLIETGYDVEFAINNRGPLRYVLRASDSKVIEEKVWIDGELKLDRNEHTLKLWYEKEKRPIEHEPSDGEVSAVARKDKQQHPFLLPLHEWAQGVRHYGFGTPLGKDNLAMTIKTPKPLELDDRDCNRVVAIFLKGQKDYGDAYTNGLLSDMKDLGYPLSEIVAQNPEHMTAQIAGQGVPLPGELRAIGVREEGVAGMVFQDTISQGMFRALSVLAQVNFSQMSGRGNCIVIDDIGEGLDFDRSSLLIELLRKKAQSGNFQLIMATNDQFVMNHVPLDEWSVLQRHGSKISVRNIHNSKKIFEDFKFVGLSNFAFFEMDFANVDSESNRQLKLEGIPGNE